MTSHLRPHPRTFAREPLAEEQRDARSTRSQGQWRFGLPLLSLLFAACATGGMEVEPALEFTGPLSMTTEPVVGQIEFEVTALGRYSGDIELTRDDEPFYAWTPDTVVRHRINTEDYEDGTYRFEVAGTLSNGQTLRDAIILTFDNDGPALNIVEPRVPDVYLEDGVFPILVEATDPVGIAELRIVVNDEMVQEWSMPARDTFNVEYDPYDADATEIVIQVFARDTNGNESEAIKRVGVLQRELFNQLIDQGEYGPTLLSDNSIAVGTQDRLTVLNEDGTQRCNTLMAVPSSAPTDAPLLYSREHNVLYWSTTDRLRLVSPTDCSVPFELETSAILGMAQLGNTVATVTFGGLLRVHEAANGMVLSEVDLAPMVAGTLEVETAITLAPDGSIFVAGGVGMSRGVLFRRTPEGTITQADLPARITGGAIADVDGVYLPGGDGRLYHYGNDLMSRWRTPPALNEGHAIQSQPVLLPGRVIVADGRAGVHGVDLADGTIDWSHIVHDDELPLTIADRGVVTDGARRFVAVGDALGRVTVLDRDGSRHLQSLLSITGVEGISGSPAIGSDRVIAINDAGLLVAYLL